MLLPAMLRSGATFPAAVRAKTQTPAPASAMKISSFTGSTAIPTGWTSPVLAPERVRSGGLLPVARSVYTVTDGPPWLVTKSSSFSRSRATPLGPERLVAGPLIVRSGAAAPSAVCA
ncbi:MAG: hypothetical protein M5U32_16455 [Myxococcota bacterium]|nr:hypothetical protein [Myxococcota bacterium]